MPPLDEFLRDVDAHAKALGKVLRIPEGALDRSVESLDVVDKAVGHLRIAKRMTPEVFTPLTAYLGEVMRLVCKGRWGKLPATVKKRYPVYDPAEHAVWAKAQDAAIRGASAEAERAMAAYMARPDDRALERAAQRASDEQQQKMKSALDALTTPPPTLLGWQEYEEPVVGHEYEPVIYAHDGALIQPVASLIRTLTERSTYGSLKTAVYGNLARYIRRP